jgi:3-carboxymuconate cyclase
MKKQNYLYTGGYNGGNGNGICCYEWDETAEKLNLKSIDIQCDNPSFLAFHPNGKWIYAANEIENSARITAHSVDFVSGATALVGMKETTGGGMCHILVSPLDVPNAVYGADYSTGNIVAFAIDADGSLGEELSNIQHIGSSTHSRQDKARAHQVMFDNSGKWLVAVDFGANVLFSYRIEESGAICEDSCVKSIMPEEVGPRHITFHSNGKTAYVITELGNQIILCDFDSENGKFDCKEVLSLLEKENKNPAVTSAEIVISPCGRFLYASVRGADIIVVFRITESGNLQYQTQFSSNGEEPRMFSFDNSGKYMFVANQKSNSLSVMRVNEEDGGFAKSCDTVSVPSVSFAAIL